MSSTRASVPQPLSLGGPATKVMSEPLTSSPRSSDTFTRRSSSGSSSAPPSILAQSPRSSVRSPTVNAHSYCGRHTDQYLFGGRRMTDLLRAIVKKD